MSGLSIMDLFRRLAGDTCGCRWIYGRRGGCSLFQVARWRSSLCSQRLRAETRPTRRYSRGAGKRSTGFPTIPGRARPVSLKRWDFLWPRRYSLALLRGMSGVLRGGGSGTRFLPRPCSPSVPAAPDRARANQAESAGWAWQDGGLAEVHGHSAPHSRRRSIQVRCQ